MNADRLLAHYERIADAPDAIARLRRFILALAVRGKLVEQDPEDESAAELVKRIAVEKARLVKSGEIKKPKALPEMLDDEPPFLLPPKWRWSQIAELGIINPRNNASEDLTASFVPMPLIPAEYGLENQHQPRPWAEIKKGYTHFAEGDVGLAKITPCFENGKSTVFRELTGGLGSGTTELHIVRPLFVNPDYIIVFLKCPHFIGTGIPRMTGTAGQKRVPIGYFANSPFPLAPLTEQHRIVAKVDELMALCDRLEAARTEREATRDRMAVSSLIRLNDPDPDPVVFRNHAAFALENLTPLTTRRDQIKAMRQTILNLAVRGKLAEQDPNDEPAFCLIERARFSMSRLIQCGEAAKMKSMPPIMEEDELFPVPKTWEWVRLGELSRLITKGSSPKWQGIDYVDKASGVLFVTSENVGNYKLKKLDKLKYVETRFNEIEPRSVLQKGDILLNLVGASIGRSAEFDLDCVANINQAVALIRPIQNDDDAVSAYLLHYLNSPVSIREMLGSRVINAQPNISLTDIRIFLVPLPPLAEQYRIVVKVDELMEIFDRLEASLARSDDTRRRMLDALLHEVLVRGADRKSVA